MKLCSLLKLVLLMMLGFTSALRAQSNPWDEVMGNSQWYVPAANLLAYMTSGTNLTATTPVSDQTIWTIGPSTNGVFSGTSNAVLKIGPVESTSTTTMNGLVTEFGQVRIAFTAEDSPTTIGIGQMREQAGVPYVEMQMITGTGGADGVYVTHWAYMASYDPEETTLPPLVLPGDLISQEWNWMAGTSWNLQSPELFGPGQSGAFQVTDYVNGYFWGSGTGPEGSAAENFTLIGSATPEGNVLFNVLSGETLTSLTGQIAGTVENGTMALRTYSPDGFGDAGAAQVVPEPGVLCLVFGGIVAVWGWHRFKRGKFLSTAD